MTALVLGLVLFLGTHSVRIVADRWRSRQIDRLGVQLGRGSTRCRPCSASVSWSGATG